MKFNLKYFGMIAESVGKTEETFELTSNQVTVSELSQILIINYVQLKQLSFKIAINQTISADNSLINEGDEIALLPPFAGG